MNAIGTMEIGRSFADALRAAGLGDLPFSWSAAGEFTYGSMITDGQKQQIAAVLSVHNPRLSALKEYAALARFRAETGGLVTAGIKVATDRQSQAMISGACLMAQANPAFTTQWKAEDGTFVTITAAEIVAMAQAVAAHVSACFSTEAALVAGIIASPAQITATAQIDAAFAAIAQ